MKDTKKIAELLSSSRIRAGASQEFLAEVLHTSTSTIHRMETGSRIPNVYEFLLWYRALGMNWFRDVLRLAHPEIYDDFEGSAEDVEQKRNGLFRYLADCPPDEVEKLAYLIFGEHGSDWPSMLDEYPFIRTKREKHEFPIIKRIFVLFFLFFALQNIAKHGKIVLKSYANLTQLTQKLRTF